MDYGLMIMYLVRSAYLRAALIYHPDKDDKLVEREHSIEKFQLIAKIYEVLKDNDLRKIYDKSGMYYL